MSELKTKTVKGVAWSAVERFSGQGINFVFNILIARVLLPEDYGVVAMLGIFLAVSQTFIDSGFGNALIRKPDRTDTDYCTVFYFNIAVSAFFCILLWLTAPLIASFYGIPLLTKITRIISLTLVINAFRAVHETQLSINMDFRRRAIITIVCVAVVGIIGLWMAHKGYGVWALVMQSVVGSVLRTILMWLLVHWRPKLVFSKNSFRELFSYGSKLLASALLDTIYGNMYTIVIGKAYKAGSLGEYNRAESFATFPSANLYGIVQNVSFPVLCSIQDDKERLLESYRKFVTMSFFICCPLMVGLAAVAEPFIRVVLTDSWIGAIPLLQLLCISMILFPVNAFNINMPNILGYSKYYLKNVTITKIIDVCILFVTIPLGLKAMCVGRIIGAFAGFFICTYYPGKLIGYGVSKQLADLLPILGISVVMGLVVLCVVFFVKSMLYKLILGILAGMFVFFIISMLLKVKELKYLLEIITRNKY
ncbi:MAG: lipopolysaccharide biosynthesis protein [Bacteroidaceae bacterium]|nr:lipopolysaccharide biosynthesis protein [Bacteroidaceae bacterium]